MTLRTQHADSVAFSPPRNSESVTSSESTPERSEPISVFTRGAASPYRQRKPTLRSPFRSARCLRPPQVMPGDHGGDYVTRLWDTGEETDYWRPGVDAETVSAFPPLPPPPPSLSVRSAVFSNFLMPLRHLRI